MSEPQDVLLLTDTVEPTAETLAPSERDWRCPQCRSDAIQSVPVIYNAGSGVSDTSAGIVGFGSDGHVLFGGGRAQGQTTSFLAASLAPPAPSERPQLALRVARMIVLGTPAACFLSFIFAISIHPALSSMSVSERGAFRTLLLCVSIGAPMLVALLLFVNGVTADKQRYQDELKEYGRDLSKWQRTYLCHRCGAQFRSGRTVSLPPVRPERPRILRPAAVAFVGTLFAMAVLSSLLIGAVDLSLSRGQIVFWNLTIPFLTASAVTVCLILKQVFVDRQQYEADLEEYRRAWNER